MVKALKPKRVADADFPEWLWDSKAWEQFVDPSCEVPAAFSGEHGRQFYLRRKARHKVQDLQVEAMRATTVCPPCCSPSQFLVAHGFKWDDLEGARKRGLVV